jgi:Sulfotransferase domain
VYEDYFRAAGDRPVRLEATPAYFYGDAPLVTAMERALGPARVIVVLREPVSRLISFFTSQKARLRIDVGTTLSRYLEVADGLDDGAFLDPANERWFGFRGGLYADHLPYWIDSYGPRLRVLFFDDLMGRPADVLQDVARWLGIDPGAFPEEELSSENRTTGYKNRWAQAFALAFNDRFEKFLRRHHGLKDRLRSTYYRVNGRTTREAVPESLRGELSERYREPNERLARQLRDAGVQGLDGALPAWLEPAATPGGGVAST